MFAQKRREGARHLEGADDVDRVDRLEIFRRQAVEIALRDEVDFIEPILAMAGTPFALVGHSYGAAVALIAALANPGRVRALALYEPTLFSVVDARSPPPNGVDGIRNAVSAAAAALDAGWAAQERQLRLMLSAIEEEAA